MRQLNMSKSLLMSVIALVLVIVLAASVTFSWVEGGDKGYVNGNELVISTGSNLTMRQDGKTTNSIIIPACTLEETSSADGRNYFFPLGGNDNSTTTTMSFREGTPNDVNTKYVSVDFELEAGDNAAEVYLGAGTIVQCSNTALLNALRMSFNLNDGTTPIVFKPNQMPGVEMKYSPIATITTAGVPTTTTTTTESYGSYYYKGDGESTPIFELEKNETLNITLAIWLEGTEFTGSAFEDSDLSIYIDFSTTVDGLMKYNFVDNCHNRDTATVNHWVGNNIEDGTAEYTTMMYIFDNSSKRYYAMDKVSDTRWEAYVPDTITNFYFRRYSIDIDEWWNEWEPDMTDIKTDPNGERTFIAIAGQEESEGTNLDGCYGYWQDAYGTFRIYFQMECAWNDLHCYAWDTSGNPCASTGAWPGKGMTFVKNVDDDPLKPLYYIDLKETENVDGITFNNGTTATTIYLGKNYGSSTYAYVHGDTGEVLGAWPGTKAEYDNATGLYRVAFKTDTAGTNFYVIVNNGNGGSGNQFPESGDGYMGQTGNAYNFYDGSFEKVAQKYNIKDNVFDEYIFNGSIFWYKSATENGFTTYLDSESSMIYPINDPTP